MTDLSDDEKPPALLSITSTRDGREHLVREDAVTPENAGRYVAVCGRRVWAVSLACPSGPQCMACSAVHTTDSTHRPPDRPGIRAWLATWWRGHPTGQYQKKLP